MQLHADFVECPQPVGFGSGFGILNFHFLPLSVTGHTDQSPNGALLRDRGSAQPRLKHSHVHACPLWHLSCKPKVLPGGIWLQSPGLRGRGLHLVFLFNHLPNTTWTIYFQLAGDVLLRMHQPQPGIHPRPCCYLQTTCLCLAGVDGCNGCVTHEPWYWHPWQKDATPVLIMLEGGGFPGL